MINSMMMVLFLIFSICIDIVSGMDNYSEKPESSNETKSSDEEELIDLAEYSKCESYLDNVNSNIKTNTNDQNILNSQYMLKTREQEENFISKSVSEMSEGNVNKLKRKKKSEKIFLCEFCQKESTSIVRGKVSEKALCRKCYDYEYKHGGLIPLSERKELYNTKHKNNILVCEFCQKESTQFTTGNVSGKSLCRTCYQYEFRNGQLVTRDKNSTKHIHDHIIVCEFCQRKSTSYVKSIVSCKSLCKKCYNYEYKYGDLIPLDERKKLYNAKHNHILECEFCQKESIKYKTGKFSGKSLCRTCYNYELQHGHLVSRDKRWNNENRKLHILVCEFCQKESTRYVTSKICGKILCRACYDYEIRHRKLVPRDKRYHEKNKNHILVCECCQQKNTQYITGKFSGKSLCKTCYTFESRNGYLVPRDERKRYLHTDTKKYLSNRLIDTENFKNEDEKKIVITKYSTEKRKKHNKNKDQNN